MLKKILFSIVLLISFNVHAVLKEVYEEVMVTVNKYCTPDQYFKPKKRSLQMSDLPGSIVGQCMTDRETYWQISLDKYFWDSHNEDDKFDVMAHEMMHCMFFKDHVDNKNNYMYYMLVKLTKQQVIEQLTVDLKKECGDKDGK